MLVLILQHTLFILNPQQIHHLYRIFIFQDSSTLSFNFQDFPSLRKSRKKSRTFQKEWELCINLLTG